MKFYLKLSFFFSLLFASSSALGAYRCMGVDPFIAGESNIEDIEEFVFVEKIDFDAVPFGYKTFKLHDTEFFVTISKLRKNLTVSVIRTEGEDRSFLTQSASGTYGTEHLQLTGIVGKTYLVVDCKWIQP